jgi:hypothetical protein
MSRSLRSTELTLISSRSAISRFSKPSQSEQRDLPRLFGIETANCRREAVIERGDELWSRLWSATSSSPESFNRRSPDRNPACRRTLALNQPQTPPVPVPPYRLPPHESFRP